MKITKKVSDSGIVRYYNEKGQLHNIFGRPAYKGWLGERSWYKNGKRHNENGPAVVKFWAKENEWWLDDVQYTEHEWKNEMFKRCFTP